MDIKTLRELDEQLRQATNALKSFEATLAACGDTKLQCLLKTCSATDLERASDALWMVAEKKFELQIEKSTILKVEKPKFKRTPCKPDELGLCFCVHCLG